MMSNFISSHRMTIRVTAPSLETSFRKKPSALTLKATAFLVHSVFIPFLRLITITKTVTRMPPSLMSRSFWSARMSSISFFPRMGVKPTTMKENLALLFGFLMPMMLMERRAAYPHPREGRRERMMIVANFLLRRL
jgi:hypothetical protein